MPAKKKNKKKKVDANKANLSDDDLADLVSEVKGLGVYEGLTLSQPPKFQPSSNNNDNLTKVVNSDQKRWAFFIADTSDGVGRRAIANQALKPGFTLVRETGFPWIVQQVHERRVCHACTAELGANSCCCVACERAFYCSAACQKNALPTHSIECKCLASKFEVDTGVDADLMRTGLAYMVKRKQPMPPASASPGVDYEPTENDLLSMMFHAEGLSESDREACVKGAQALRNGLPPEYHLSDTQITEFFCRVNANSHGLVYPTGPQDRQYGLGLFPLCAIFNHSCYPNVVFVNEGNRLVFRVIRPVLKGEELVTNYIALYQSRRQRQQELWISKHFVCTCRRCNLTPISQEERERFFNDKLLDGVCCKGKKDCKGVYQPTTLSALVLEEKSAPSTSASTSSSNGTEQKDSTTASISTSISTGAGATTTATATTAATATPATAATVSTATAITTTGAGAATATTTGAGAATSTTTGAGAATATTSTATTPSITSAASASAKSRGDIWRCADCGHSVSYATTIAPIEKEVSEVTQRAVAEFETSKATPAVKREMFEGIIRKYNGVVTPQYSQFFNIYLGLANLCGNQNDQRSRLDYIRLILKYTELVFPRHFLPSAAFYRVLADSIDKTIAERNEKGLNNKAIVGKYALEKKEALWTHYEILVLCCGPDSPRALEAKAWYNRNVKAV